MAEAQENAGLIDEDEARNRDLRFEPAPATACKHCGRDLKPLGVAFGGKFMWVSHEKCGCAGELEGARKAQASAEKAAADARIEKLMSCGIERRFLDARVSTPGAGLYLAGFAEAAGQGLYIYGNVGRGKTSEASALAREFIDAGYVVLLTGVTEMLASIQKTYDGIGQTSQVMSRYTACDVLVLDDFGKESSSAWTVGMLFQIINARYQAMRPTIYTSQYSLEELRRKLAVRGGRETAEAIASRMAQTSNFIHLTGPDRRLARAD